MARVVFPADMQSFTDGRPCADVSASSFPELVEELCQRFPALDRDTIGKYSLAIDGMIIHTPMLEAFGHDSELVFVTRIAGG